MNANDIHYLTKRALKGDVEKARIVLRYLDRYRVSVASISAYLIVFQFAMNLLDISEECRFCGGRCCKERGYIPIYQFDIDDVTSMLGADAIRYFMKINSNYYLGRPCPFLKDWMCSINKVKPYACLSYPFASEEIQIGLFNRESNHPYPQPFIPHHCIAGYKAWKIISQAIDEFNAKNGRIPKPIELLEILWRALNNIQ
ncbi:MAG: YkgJ family cysteine cluster protein [Ignisphaera sp.]